MSAHRSGIVPDSRPVRIGFLARETGLSPDTLRHYERVGVLPIPGRSANGYREYPAAALGRIQLVQRALACGFTLAELAPVLALRDRGGTPCQRVRAMAAGKLAAVEEEIARLTERRDSLRRTLEAWDRRLAQTRRGRQALLLDHFEHAPDPRPRQRLRRVTSARGAATNP